MIKLPILAKKCDPTHSCQGNKTISCWFPWVCLQAEQLYREGYRVTTTSVRFKICRLFVLCCVWAVGFGVQGGCVLVVTAGTLKFLLNWSKTQLTAMAETGWELQNNLFSPGAQSSASCPWKPTLMGIFLKLNLKARGRLPSFLFFPYWTALGSCKSSCFKLSFLPVWTLWTGFLQHQRQGGRSPASATDKGMVTTSTRGKQLCQINQLQCEAASLDYTYTVL